MLDKTKLPSPFHEGEVSIQKRLGVAEKSEQFGSKFIRTYMPDQHRAFFQQLPLVFLGGLDRDGQPWATYMAGQAGFMISPSETQLDINASLAFGDPLSHTLNRGDKIGLLGIELSTRRRNRLNGYIEASIPGKLTIKVEQSFGNCPKYIHPRNLELIPDTDSPVAPVVQKDITEDVKNVLETADLFFIASRSADLNGSSRFGVDMSHRGGDSGFIHVIGRKSFIFPDYPGNRFFNTLGNIQSEPRVGLLFLDFQNNRTLHIAGRANIVWDGDERSTRINVEHIHINPNTTVREKSIS